MDVELEGSRTDSENSSSSDRTSKLDNSPPITTTTTTTNTAAILKYPPGFHPPPTHPESQSADLLQAPATDFASPSSSSLNKPHLVECERKQYCMPCIGKWVSDMSEFERLDISKLVEYLREEFQSVYFTKAEEKLRLLEEEEEQKVQARENIEQELRVYKEKCSELFESSEEELREYKDKCSELLVLIGKLESTEGDLMECKVKCEELKEKVMYLEMVNADKDREISELKKNNEDSECIGREDVEKDGFEFDLEPDMSLKEYMLKVKGASKAKKGVGKMKSRQLVEIVAKDFPKQQKRSRRSGVSGLGEEGKKNSRKRSHEGKAEKEVVKGKGDIALERKTKRVKTNLGALGYHANVKTKNRPVLMKTRIRILDESKKKNMKRNRQALGKAVDVNTKIGADQGAVRSTSRMLDGRKKKDMKSSEALDNHVDVRTKNRALEEAEETRTNSLPVSNKKTTKRSRTALEKHVDIQTKEGVDEAMRTRSKSLAESNKRIRKKSRVLLEDYVDVTTKRRAVEKGVKGKSEIVDNPGKSTKRQSKSDGANVVNNSSSTNGGSVTAASCHQCKTRRVEILSCMNCKRRYCFLCMRNRYPQMSHGEIEKSCPACRGNCNCKACLRKKGEPKVTMG